MTANDSRRGAESVYQAVRDEISRGLLAPGADLVETAVAARFGVSRTPVREALRRLEQDRLIERGARGMRVRDVDPQEVLELYEARIVLEAAVARAAAERRSAGDVALLRNLVAADQAEKPADPSDRARTNVTFHRAVWRAAHNRVLIDLLERLGLHLLRHPETTLAWPGRWEQAIDQHERLTDAIERREGDVAAGVAEEHFTQARDVRLASWHRTPPPAQEDAR